MSALGLSRTGQYRKYLVASCQVFVCLALLLGWRDSLRPGLFFLFLSELNSRNSTDGTLGLSSSSKTELYEKLCELKGEVVVSKFPHFFPIIAVEP